MDRAYAKLPLKARLRMCAAVLKSEDVLVEAGRRRRPGTLVSELVAFELQDIERVTDIVELDALYALQDDRLS